MLGDNLKKYRKMRYLSQEELAEVLGVSRQSISLWETGKTQPNVDTLSKLAIILGVTVDTLLIEDQQQGFPKGTQLEQYMEDLNTADSNVPKNPKKRWSPIFVVLAVVLLIGIVFAVWQWFFRDPPFVDDPAAIEYVSQQILSLRPDFLLLSC